MNRTVRQLVSVGLILASGAFLFVSLIEGTHYLLDTHTISLQWTAGLATGVVLWAAGLYVGRDFIRKGANA